MSPGTKIPQPQRTESQDSTADGIRKRVCKACDRCRMKKSRCDGSQPCLRCKADNAICVFGERKRSHDKVYPKGYVEMLEQQQAQLVSGLQELYRRLRSAKQWDGAKLEEVDGNPLTHDILAALHLLQRKQDGDLESFEENVEKLQARLLAAGAGFSHRRGSVSSESENSQLGHARSMSQDAPPPAKVARSATLPTIIGSSATSAPTPVQFQARPQRPAILASNDSQMSQLSQMSGMSPLGGDPHLYQPEWAFAQATAANKRMAAQFAMQNERILIANMQAQQQQLQQQQQAPSFDPVSWNTRTDSAHDINMAGASVDPWATQHYLNLVGASSAAIPRSSFDAAADADQMDLDLSQYIHSTGV